MEIFIGNLSPKVTHAELVAFFKGFSKKVMFRFEQKKLEDGSTVRFAVAECSDDKYALKMVEKFSGQTLHGREVILREYIHRSYNNERRAVNWREKPWRAGERRRNDRRLKEERGLRDEFEDILASSSSRDEEERRSSGFKIEGYRDLARKN